MIIVKTPMRMSFFGGGTDNIMKNMEEQLYLQLLINIAIIL